MGFARRPLSFSKHHLQSRKAKKKKKNAKPSPVWGVGVTFWWLQTEPMKNAIISEVPEKKKQKLRGGGFVWVRLHLRKPLLRGFLSEPTRKPANTSVRPEGE